ncbi:MAG: ester cyclase [Sphingomonadales bacterium]
MLRLIPAIAALLISAPALAVETACEGHEDNLQTYLEMTDILFNQRLGDRAGEYYADEFINHNSDAGGLTYSTVTPEEMGKLWARLSDHTPDRLITNELIICQADLVIARVNATGRRIKGDMEGNPKNGRRYRYTAIDIYRFKDGKVIERWGNNDRIAMIRQLGLAVDLSMTPLPDNE